MKTRGDITKTLLLVWPLLFGMFMIMVGNGLQGTLLSLRAELAGFEVMVIGIVMSLYYCGYMAGWYIVPQIINSVGHIRVFAGFASLASTTILLQGLFVNPYTWGVVRMASGLSFVGLFIVAESWLNDAATNKLRGQIFSSYLFVVHAGLFTGQFLINLAPVENISLFILVSILVSLSLIPITLANKPSPGFKEPEPFSFKKLIGVSPFSVACVTVAGFTGAAMLAMGPVYAHDRGFPVSAIALLLGVYVLGCGVVPLVTGWLSDRMDRRKLLIIVAFCGVIVTAVPFFTDLFLYILVFLFGGCTISVYSIASALLNDRLRPAQRTSATASLILVNGISACLGPLVAGGLMQAYGPSVFFPVFTTIYFMLFLYGLYRAHTGPEIRVEKQGEFHALPARGGTPEIAKLGKMD